MLIAGELRRPAMARLLTKHQDIRQWVEARAGNPLLMDMPDGAGGTRQLLQITFGQHFLNADENEGPDRPGGWELVGWDDWFAALEAQELGVLVSDDPSGGSENEFQIVARSGRGQTTSAAQKPPV
jgi:hypothetical protein